MFIFVYFIDKIKYSMIKLKCLTTIIQYIRVWKEKNEGVISVFASHQECSTRRRCVKGGICGLAYCGDCIGICFCLFYILAVCSYRRIACR